MSNLLETRVKQIDSLKEALKVSEQARIDMEQELNVQKIKVSDNSFTYPFKNP